MTQDSKPRIDDKTVRHVANLAHLELSDAELAGFGVTLQKILAYVAELDTLPATVDTEAASTVDPAPERPDRVIPPLSVDLALAAAPAKEGSAFLVPRIIE